MDSVENPENYEVTDNEHGRTLYFGGRNESVADEEAPAAAGIEDTHPDFEEVCRLLDARAGALDPNPSLDRIALLMDYLGEPQSSFNVIQVAGTNGKTSTARMTESLLRALGPRTGLFTSPELERVTDCILIDGAEITQTRFVEIYREIEPYALMVDEQFDTPMSRFELLVGIAYAAFADAPVEVAVVEVGMGGTWDATNVVDADVAVITSIGLDHQQFLGDTLGGIATQKAGIIKSGATVAVLGQQEPEAQTALLERAVEQDVPVARAGSEFTVGDSVVAVGGQMLTLNGLSGVYPEVFLPLAGAHQAANSSLALAAVESFFGVPLDMDAVRTGFAQVTTPGRLERMHVDPVVLIDAAHNPHGAAALAETMQRDFNFTAVIGVISIFADKDAAAILHALRPVLREVVISQSTDPRAMNAEDLADSAREIFGEENVRVEPHLPGAIALAMEVAEEDDGVGVLVTGSVATAGEARTFLRTYQS